MIERLKYWLFQKGKGCHSCCIRCEYFDICRWDVMTGKTAEQEQTVELLAVEAARKNGNTGLLYRIYKYVEFKKRARRKYLCYKRQLNKDEWKMLYRQHREERRKHEKF